MYYSEAGLDKFIRETFYPDYFYKGTMIEVGAGPPAFISMSKHFRDNGWRCICIEPNPNFVKQHIEHRNEIYEYACSNIIGESEFKISYMDDDGTPADTDGVSYSAIDFKHFWRPEHLRLEKIKVKVITLNSLLEQLQINKVDYISIDVEGWEIEVLEGIDLVKYSPTIISTECLTQEETFKIEAYLTKFNYRKIKRIHNDDVYLLNNLLVSK